MDQQHRTGPPVIQGVGTTPNGLDDEVSLVEILSVFLRHRGIFIRVLFLSASVSFLVAMARPARYISSASFLPESSEPSASGALALAQQFGVSVGGGSGERTPQFYADLVTSSEILRRTVVRDYPITDTLGERSQIDLIEYYEVDEETQGARIERTIERLVDDIVVGVDPNTGIVNFSITTSDPLLSHGLAAHILDLVNDFDLNTRQSQAGAERLFAGERVAQLTKELRQAEDSLQSFLVENRVFSNSPTLQFEHDRLQWAVTMRQELVTSLAQAFEQARIDEVRNTPVITLIEPPRVPALRAPKRRVVIMIMGIIVGAVGGAFAVFFRSYMGRSGGKRPSDLQELASLWGDTKKDLRRFLPWPSRRSTV